MGWATGASVFTPIWPGKAYWPVRWHGFANIGKVVGYDRGVSVHRDAASCELTVDRSFTDNVVKVYRHPNVSVGLGLMYRCVGSSTPTS